jgi:hypothetical protein
MKTKNYWLVPLILILVFISYIFIKHTAASDLLAQLYANGSVTIEDEKGFVASIEPFVEAGEPSTSYIFKGNATQISNEIVGELSCGSDFKKVYLTGHTEWTKDGLKIHYEMTNSGDISFRTMGVKIALDGNEWLVSHVQMGSFYTQTAIYDKPFCKIDSPGLVFIGPSVGHNDLYMCLHGESLEGIGNNLLSKVFYNHHAEKNNLLGFILQPLDKTYNVDPNQNQSFIWKKGEKKIIEFLISCNREGILKTNVRDTKQFTEGLKKWLALKTIPVTQSSVSIESATTGLPDYPIPSDAKKIQCYVENTFHNYRFYLPTEIYSKGTTFTGFLHFDTGAPGSFFFDGGEIQLREDFFNRLGLKSQKRGPTISRVLEGQLEQKEFYSISKDNSLKVGDIVLDGMNFYTDPLIDQTFINDANNAKNGLAGNVLGTFTLFAIKNYLVSIDYKNNIIYFRPMHTGKRTFFDSNPLFTIPIEIDNKIHIPIKLNNEVRETVIFDTGSPLNLFFYPQLPLSVFPVTSYKLGDYELCHGRKIPDFALFNENEQADCGSIGNITFKNKFITIDPGLQKIYVEKEW